jgi:hypothetical protein
MMIQKHENMILWAGLTIEGMTKQGMARGSRPKEQINIALKQVRRTTMTMITPVKAFSSCIVSHY